MKSWFLRVTLRWLFRFVKRHGMPIDEVNVVMVNGKISMEMKSPGIVVDKPLALGLSGKGIEFIELGGKVNKLLE